MSNPTRKHEDHGPPAEPKGAEAARAEADEAAARQGEPAQPAPEPGAASQPSPADEIAALKDQLLRNMAELENYRRRAEKERQDTAKYAIAGFARDCLSVLDNLRRGLDSVSAADRTENPALETLAAGMELTERELLATFERHGISRIDAEGKHFDHNLHQAMFEIEDPSRPAGTVVQVAAPGYLLNGRLLRPAMVGVAKGGARTETVHAAPIANEDVGAGSRERTQDSDHETGPAGRSEPPESSGHDDGNVDSRA